MHTHMIDNDRFEMLEHKLSEIRRFICLLSE